MEELLKDTNICSIVVGGTSSKLSGLPTSVFND